MAKPAVAANEGEASPEWLVSMRGVYKSFGSIDALKGVDLRLGSGEVLGLVGDNAAGK